MADPTHLAKLLEGVDAWNAWRSKYPDITPNLEQADLTPAGVRGTALLAVDADTACQFVNLQEVDFRETRLFGAQMTGAYLRGALLDGANLQTANLLKADLQSANLSTADLRGADLERTNFQGANLEHANLRMANLRFSHLEGAWLVTADLQSARLAGASLNHACLVEADFQSAELQGANLQEANLAEGNLRGAKLERTNFEGANVTGVKFGRSSRQRAYQGIRVSGCYGSQRFKSFAQDQDYVEELRMSGRLGSFKFWVWYLLADCGRSFIRWAFWSGAIAFFFSLIYYCKGPEIISPGHLPFSLKTMIYYSIVTFTTLGFGDIIPKTENAAMVVMAEVILGYIMLGGLISILANKVARRA